MKASLTERLERSEREKDVAVRLLAVAGLQLLEPSEARWEVERLRAMDQLGLKESILPLGPVLKKKVGQAKKEWRSALTAIEKANWEHRHVRRRLEVLKQRREERQEDLTAAFVHETLLSEEMALLDEKREEDSSRAMAQKIDLVEKERRYWQGKRKLAEKKVARLRRRIEKLERRLPLGSETHEPLEIRLKEAEASLRRAKEDAEFFGWLANQWRATEARELLSKGRSVQPAESFIQSPLPVQINEPEENESEIPFIEVIEEEDEFIPEQDAEPVQWEVPPSLYRVAKGDTLPSVAEKVLGDSRRWPAIYEANEYAILRGLLEPGQWLVIPRAAGNH
ncbi:MAG: LysM peptidoglycan-binding domain-containing protein [Elusimicrobia bacterium]|nr:LysM peptidoglycan-binding domain-containing protein [Elusimicrobiota bacterium]